MERLTLAVVGELWGIVSVRVCIVCDVVFVPVWQVLP